ncbi:MAG TPA: hypothetical protein IAB61_07790 [Candidatus Merdisoma merdipullorum]|nr:hypothetical protein [Candidatus Merdisoma merdipullorum]
MADPRRVDSDFGIALRCGAVCVRGGILVLELEKGEKGYEGFATGATLQG